MRTHKPLGIVCALMLFGIAASLVLSWNSRNFETISASVTPPTVVGFYHLYERAGEEDILDSIVREQLLELNSSNLLRATSSLYWTYIGAKHESYRLPLDFSRVVQKKSSQSALNGTEMVTLQLISEHCRQNGDDLVYYIHSKGSFTHSPENELLRRNLMKAINACWVHQFSHESDICGFRFSPLPHPHFSGNMWWAQCRYINKLIRPLDFPTAMSRFLKDAPENAMVGNGRYCAEHWVSSHPCVRASDVLPRNVSFGWGYGNLPQPHSWTPALATFPREGLQPAWFVENLYGDYLSWPGWRLAEYKSLFGDTILKSALPLQAAICQWPKLFADYHLDLLEKNPESQLSRGFVVDYMQSERELREACGRPERCK